ncbi:MAG: TraR/DksA family transcriptional regulator [Anaerolineae bacterium]
MPMENEEIMQREKERLESERDKTLKDLARLRELLKNEVEVDLDEGDPELYEREKNLALAQTLERKLESIERALRLVEKGTYGICEMCGETIDPARLEILPDTTLCLKCKTKIERQAKRRSSSASDFNF